MDSAASRTTPAHQGDSFTNTAGSSSGQPTSGEASTTLDASTTSGSTEDATTIAVTLDPTGDSTSSSSGAEESDSSSSGSIDVLDPDLIAWYRFDTLEEGSVPHSGGNDHLASCEQCPGAIETDGIAQHLVVANTPQFTTQTWTIAARVWSGETPTTFETVVGKPLGEGVANSCELGMNPSNESTGVVSGWSDGLASQGLAVALPASQEWFHGTATLSDTTATLYLDGEVVDEEVLAIIPALDDNELHIGADIDDQVLNSFFVGRIDNLRIYRRALSVDEVSMIMTGENL